jgi:dTDP-4-dehydrorhamnose 3,5-epimerase
MMPYIYFPKFVWYAAVCSKIVVFERETMKCYRPQVFSEVIIIEPKVFGDSRGYFLETYQAKRYATNGIPASFVQDNVSFSANGVIRGLHYQLSKPQGKLVSVAFGEVFDVSVDIRKGSPTFGKWFGITLSSDSAKQVYVPEGFAHGFCVTSEKAIVTYKCTDYYAPEEERGIPWDDPFLNIAWPNRHPVLSEKDASYPPLDQLSKSDLPVYSEEAGTI